MKDQTEKKDDPEGEFELLYEQFGDEVQRYLFTRVGYPDWQDLAQEVWSAVKRTIFDRHIIENPRNFIFFIARRRVIDCLRRRNKEGSRVSDACLKDRAIRGKRRLEAMGEELSVAFNKLSPAEQKILRLKFYEDLTMEQIGNVLGKSAASACRAVKSALSRLRKLMGEGNGE